MAAGAAGWYPDPEPSAPFGRLRYWDGQRWGDATAGPVMDGYQRQQVLGASATRADSTSIRRDGGFDPASADPAVIGHRTPGPAGRGPRHWPLWAKIAVPAVAVVSVGSLAGGMGDGGDPPVDTTGPATTVTGVAAVAGTVAAGPVATGAAPTTLPVTTVPPATLPATTVPPASVPSGVDARYGTCREAKAHGLGPYVRGVDAEYSWYRDADGDGIVCE